MRTKTLVFTAAALAAGILAASAQVYSANVVGYVNKTFADPNRIYLVTTPLDSGNNVLSNLFVNPPDQTGIYIWDPLAAGGSGDFVSNAPFTYSAGSHVWSDALSANVSGYALPPGLGYFVAPGANFTNTFVGNVLQGGPLVNPVSILPSPYIVILGSVVPIGGSISNVVTAGSFPVHDQDAMYLWDPSINPAGDLDVGHNYQGINNQWNPEGTLSVGDAFVYSSSDTVSKTWSRTFTVQ